MSAKTCKYVPEKMVMLVDEIYELSKVRQSLTYGTKTGSRDTAESIISRRINDRVKKLSNLIMGAFETEE